MKKFLEITLQMKFVWGLFFSAAMLIYTVITMILGYTSMKLITVWQLLVITLIITFLHYLIFGELILQSLSERNKILVHFILCYTFLIVSALLLNWINISNINTIVIFTIGYIILYLLCVVSFYIYYKATGEELNKKLTAYKEKRNLS